MYGETATSWNQALSAIEQAITLFQGKGATAYVERAEQRREKVLAMRKAITEANSKAGPGLLTGLHP